MDPSASLDRIDEAVAAIAKLKIAESDRPSRHITAANRGLIAFRRGDEATGRRYYAEAIDGFRRDGALELSARAKIYLAREAIRASTADWPALLKEAQDAMTKFKDSEGVATLRLVEKQAQNNASTQSDAAHSRRLVDKVRPQPRVTVTFELNQALAKPLTPTPPEELV